MEPTHLGGRQLSRRAQWMEPRAPERLVDVDVPHPGERALVEERGLDRSAPPREPPPQLCRGELVGERLRAEPLVEVRIELARLEEQPRAEPSHVAIGDVRPVV